ncbi:hypothetical protein AAF712_003317 [Marasmius tenuissimus]|uniref:FAD-binding PCMH-type domain-containing protein n=1 Tax=Marasmius tenuissimus TaxID=585030 RepID=A0ABR3A8I4_9AGAR|nr:hypothetical protein PM082_012169 [Marasmius tenuissimus]
MAATRITRFLVFSFVVLSPSLPSLAFEDHSCRILPSDDAWPNESVWDAFNTSVDGRLIKVVPDGLPCHDPEYNENLCEVVRENWLVPQFHSGRPGSIMNSLLYNRSCDPFAPRETPCTMRNVVEYSVNVSQAEHIIKAVQFVKEHNIRFVVKNTGHDYMGKSTGTGALSVWMHNFQGIEWVPDYVSTGYTGPAIKAPAGIQGKDLATFAGARGHAIVSGECPSVGFAGGYIQGGGHSIITSAYGMAADQTLEFEVVTMQGEHLVATPTQNEDLYWALSGGGGGTYAVVLSVTVKVFPDGPLTLGFLNFTEVRSETYWQAVAAYNAIIPDLTSSRTTVFASYASNYFEINHMVAVNQTGQELTAVIRPFLDSLDDLGIQYNFSTRSDVRYLDVLEFLGGILPSIGDQVLATRLLPRSLWDNETGIASVVDATRQVLEGFSGVVVADLSFKPPTRLPGDPQNAVLPAWRESQRAVFSVVLYAGNETQAEASMAVQKVSQAISTFREISPGSGAYLNEGDLLEPNFKDAFYGPNYDRLLNIKDKWDPDQILYGSTAVGGDRWREDEDGRLCKVVG